MEAVPATQFGPVMRRCRPSLSSVCVFVALEDPRTDVHDRSRSPAGSPTNSAVTSAAKPAVTSPPLHASARRDRGVLFAFDRSAAGRLLRALLPPLVRLPTAAPAGAPRRDASV